MTPRARARISSGPQRVEPGRSGDERAALAIGLGVAVVACDRALSAARHAWPFLAPAVVAAFVVVVGAGLLVAGRRRRKVGSGRAWNPFGPSGYRRGRGGEEGARWASRRELARCLVGSDEQDRLVLGTLEGRRIGLEAGHSLLVVGPTQSGKTSGLAVPAILEWRGPVVSTSVKTDLVRATHAFRASLGRALVYDPAGVAGVPRTSWSPLAGSTSWAGARRTAAALCSVARAGNGSGLEDAGFWYATAEKLLAPLLLAASRAGAGMGEVVRWVDTEEVDEVVFALELSGEVEALQAAEASFRREERQRASVYTTAETVLASFADPLVASCSTGDEVEVERLVGGGRDTLYLVGPAHEQERLQAPFVCLLRSVLDAVFTTSARQGAPLDPPLLLVLDEAANVAPLAGLDGLVATAASHGIQVVTLWQDLAQVEARYGPRAATVVNNHRAKLVCPGVGDPSTLEQVSRLAGEEVSTSWSTTRDPNGQLSTTIAPLTRRLAPADLLRRLPQGEALLLYGDLQPARIELRPYFLDPLLAARAAGGSGEGRLTREARRGERRRGHHPWRRRGWWRGRASG